MNRVLCLASFIYINIIDLYYINKLSRVSSPAISFQEAIL